MSRPVQRLRRRLVLAFAGFAVLVATVFGLYALVFMYAVEDSVFDAQLAREADAQHAAYARHGSWRAPGDAGIQLYLDPARFPDDLRRAFLREPWRSEFSGDDGRHYHVRPLDPPPPAAPAWLVAEVSPHLVVRPIRDRVVLLLACTAVLMVLLAIGLGAWLARRGTRPLYRLVQRVEALPLQPQAGSTLAAEFTDDEIGVLARALDRLSQRVADFVAREHAFTRDASHELRTPLAVISSAAGQLLDEPGLSIRGRQHVQHIQLSALQLQQAVAALLALAREDGDTPVATGVRLVPLLERVIVEQSPLLGTRPVQVHLDVPVQATLRAPEPALRMVLANLVGNAFAHTPVGSVHIAMDQGDLLVHNQSSTAATLRDWPQPRPFDKGESSPGSGLGLEIMRRLCDHHGLQLQMVAGADGVCARLRGVPAPGRTAPDAAAR